jgi:hypothetical protein
MAVTYRIIARLDLVVSTWSGVVTLDESHRHNAALKADPDFEPTMAQLSDARGVERSAVTASGVRGLARTSAFGPEARRAILASSDEIFGISRAYQSQGYQAGNMRVFRDLDAALEWLGIDPEELDRVDDGDGRIHRL